jgi:hypothetical protein
MRAATCAAVWPPRRRRLKAWCRGGGLEQRLTLGCTAAQLQRQQHLMWCTVPGDAAARAPSAAGPGPLSRQARLPGSRHRARFRWVNALRYSHFSQTPALAAVHSPSAARGRRGVGSAGSVAGVPGGLGARAANHCNIGVPSGASDPCSGAVRLCSALLAVLLPVPTHPIGHLGCALLLKAGTLLRRHYRVIRAQFVRKGWGRGPSGARTAWGRGRWPDDRSVTGFRR